MRDTRRSRRPQVETLETMTLLSGVTAMVMPQAPAPAAMTRNLPIPEIVGLNGQASGSYTSSRKISDAGAAYKLEKVSGMFDGYGKGVVTGTLHTPGFIRNSRSVGTLKVALPGGAVFVALSSGSQKSFAGLPSQVSYVITRGTGRFHDAAGDPTGRGVIDVSSRASSGLMIFSGHGKISLNFRPQNVTVA